MEPEREMDEDQWRQISGFVNERRRGKPLAYITRSKEFFSRNFFVDERVLIPRPETELLVEEAIDFIEDRNRNIRVLDMGTGSGAVGLTLAATGANVLCVDVSTDAIDVARRNAHNLGLEDRVSFVVSDLWSGLGEGGQFAVICANLPYVTRDEYTLLDVGVKEYEPREALLGGNDGLELYRRFVRDARNYLSPEGAILCEVGGRQQAESLKGMLEKEGLQAIIRNDLAGRQRVVKGIWTSLS
jgi:release factor glutamine methyltransferase